MVDIVSPTGTSVAIARIMSLVASNGDEHQRAVKSPMFKVPQHGAYARARSKEIYTGFSFRAWQEPQVQSLLAWRAIPRKIKGIPRQLLHPTSKAARPLGSGSSSNHSSTSRRPLMPSPPPQWTERLDSNLTPLDSMNMLTLGSASQTSRSNRSERKSRVQTGDPTGEDKLVQGQARLWICGAGKHGFTLCHLSLPESQSLSFWGFDKPPLSDPADFNMDLRTQDCKFPSIALNQAVT
ncbi:hypothetical protein V8F06_010809 [Rhypophila decipiens]